MKTLFLTFFMLLATQGVLAQEAVIPIEGAVESRYVELLVDNSGNGTVVIPDCSDCPVLRVNQDTQFLLKNTPITAAEARAHARKGATVIYDLQTKLVTRVRM